MEKMSLIGEIRPPTGIILFMEGDERLLVTPPPAAVLDCGLHYNILSRPYLTKFT